ncbi:hypothetical protein SCNU_19872 [Gordonia neofelifaecis NRRL B-59395]|uniref:Uncharacterized protein n=1 Tax=Gordonia neofelifaecis NRRL B-59395 TaxID=644548 RepID=F1YPW3_9ACTN|nr:hypothetical protein SCNU_19872 [Gordonia neofelifaecis NRRL B-59395]
MRTENSPNPSGPSTRLAGTWTAYANTFARSEPAVTQPTERTVDPRRCAAASTMLTSLPARSAIDCIGSIRS